MGASAPAVEVKPPDGWLTNANGREYIPRGSPHPGVIWRQGEETIDQARARDQSDRGKEKPRRRTGPAKAKKPPAPTQVDLKKLEHALAEGLKMPGMVAASVGDEWGLHHFTKPGLGGSDYLARNLVAAAEYNPWLKEQLEKATTGEAFAVKLITSFGLAAALFAYAVPPVVYYLNLPFPDLGRDLFEIPPRVEPQPSLEDADPPAPPEASAPAPAPARPVAA